MSPDYSKYSLEQLYDVRAKIDSARFPERANEVELWIKRREQKPLIVNEVIWLKPPTSMNHQKQLLILVFTILLMLPFLISFGPNVVQYDLLNYVEGSYKGSSRAYHSTTAVFYDFQVGNATYKVAGEWPRLLALKPESRVQMLVFGKDVWEVTTNGKNLVSYSEFHQYANNRKRQNWIIAICLFIGAIFSLSLYMKLKKANALVLPKAEVAAQQGDDSFNS